MAPEVSPTPRARISASTAGRWRSAGRRRPGARSRGRGTRGGPGDNRNALASANQQTQGILANGTISVNGAVSSLITGIGSEAQQVNTAQAAQTAVNSQAQKSVQSVSGVNLDEEAASLLQWQQSYQAAAQALKIGSSLFQSLLTAVQAA